MKLDRRQGKMSKTQKQKKIGCEKKIEKTHVSDSRRGPPHPIRPANKIVSDVHEIGREVKWKTDHRSIPKPVASEFAPRSSQT